MKATLLTVLISLLTCFSFPGRQRVLAETGLPPCVAGRTAARFGFWTWPSHSSVNVYLRTPDFSESDGPAVETAMKNWNQTSIENGSQVHFVFKGLASIVSAAQGDFTLIRNPVYGKKERHLALLEAHSLRGDQLIDWALVIVDPTVRNASVLTNVMAHEIGHSLGLLDCPKCHGGGAGRGARRGADESNGIDGPTACDKLTVLAAYEELKLRVARAPLSSRTTEAADVGEEPEEDDTPIVSEAIAAYKAKTTQSTGPSRQDAGNPRRPPR